MGKEVRSLTVRQQQLEDAINDHESTGSLLNAMGIISDEELQDAIAKDEQYKLRVEASPEEAERVAAEVGIDTDEDSED